MFTKRFALLAGAAAVVVLMGTTQTAQSFTVEQGVYTGATPITTSGRTGGGTGGGSRTTGAGAGKTTVDVDVNRGLQQLMERLIKEQAAAQKQSQRNVAEAYNKLINSFNKTPDRFFNEGAGKELFKAQSAAEQEALQKIVKGFKPGQSISFFDYLKSQEYIQQQGQLGREGAAIELNSPARIKDQKDPVTGKIKSIEKTGGYEKAILSTLLQQVAGNSGFGGGGMGGLGGLAGGLGGSGGFGGGGSGGGGGMQAFANSLFAQIFQRIFAESAHDQFYGARSNVPESNGDSSVPATQVTGAAGGFSSAELIKPIFTGSGIQNVLGTLNSCSDPNDPSPNTCVIDDGMRQAITDGLTVGQAVQKGDLKRNAPFGYLSDGLEPSYQEGYPQRTTMLLRKYRIVPVTWELAAAYVKSHGSKTFGEILDAYDDIQSPFYHLIDPRWVLKVPETYCRRAGPGPEITNTNTVPGVDKNEDGDFEDPGDTPPKLTLTRAGNYCADEQQCLEEDQDGRCKYYGYCSQEKRLWHLNGQSCEPVYNSCESFRAPTGDIVSYLKNSVDYGTCNLQSAGCRAYSISVKENVHEAPFVVKQQGFDSVDPAERARVWPGFVDPKCNSTASCTGGATQSTVSERAGGKSLQLFSTVDWRITFVGEQTDRDFVQLGTANRKYSMVVRAKRDDGPNRPREARLRVVLKTDAKRYAPDEVPVDTQWKAYTLPIDTSDALNIVSGFPQIEFALVTQELQRYNLGENEVGNVPNNVSIIYIDSVKVVSEDTLPDKEWNTAADKELYLNRSSNSCDAQYAGCTQYLTVTKNDPVNSANNAYLSADGSKVGEITGVINAAVRSQITSYADLATSDGSFTFQQTYLTGAATVCRAEDVGCDLYEPVRRADDLSVPAVVQSGDRCPAACVGMDKFEQGGSTFEPTPSLVLAPYDAVYTPEDRHPVFIPAKGRLCTAEAVGCEEFTNLDEVPRGGEIKSYFQTLKQCQKPGADRALSDAATYFIQQGSDRTGFQISSYELKAEGATSSPDGVFSRTSGAPCTALNENGTCNTSSRATCSAADLATNPDCREVISLDHSRYYVLWSKTITVSDQCHPYRRTKVAYQNDIVAEADCKATGGKWQAQGCVYNIVSSEVKACSLKYAGCREYKHAQAANVRILLEERFDDETAKARWSTEGTGVRATWTWDEESEIPQSHSMKLTLAASGAQTAMTLASGTGSTERALTMRLEAQLPYVISFWARTDSAAGRVAVSVEDNSSSPVIARALTENSIDNIWREYTIGPMVLSRDLVANSQPNLILRASAVNATAAPQFILVDNLRVSFAQEYVVKNSWANNLGVCRNTYSGAINPPVSGDTAFIGCRAYRAGTTGQVVTVKSFTNLCKREVVGCQAMINTRNSDSPLVREAQGDEPAAARIASDDVVFLVNDRKNYCPAAQKGCQLLGLKTVDGDTRKVNYSTVVGLNDPERYDATTNTGSILCTQAQVGCQEFVGEQGSTFFKDPGDGVCDYKIVEGETSPRWWRRPKGANEKPRLCDNLTKFSTIGSNGPVLQPDGSNDNWVISCTPSGPGFSGSCAASLNRKMVGACPAAANLCTEYIDPTSKISTNVLANSDFSLQFSSLANTTSALAVPTNERFVYYQPQNPTSCLAGDSFTDGSRGTQANLQINGAPACVHFEQARVGDFQYLAAPGNVCLAGHVFRMDGAYARCYIPDTAVAGATSRLLPDSWGGPVDGKVTGYRQLGDDWVVSSASQDIRLEPNILYSLSVSGSGSLMAQIENCSASATSSLVSPDGSMAVENGSMVLRQPVTNTGAQIVSGRLIIRDTSESQITQNCSLFVSEQSGAQDTSHYVASAQLRRAGVYYALSKTLDRNTCNGRVDNENGCVLLNERAVQAQIPDDNRVRNGDFETLTRLGDGTPVPSSWTPVSPLNFNRGAGLNGNPWAALDARQDVELTPGVIYSLTAFGTNTTSSPDSTLTLNNCRSEATGAPAASFSVLGIVGAAKSASGVEQPHPSVSVELSAGRKKSFGASVLFQSSVNVKYTCTLTARSSGMIDQVSLKPLTNETEHRFSALTLDANKTQNSTGLPVTCDTENGLGLCQPNANVLVKATPDRQCSQWLACRSAIEAPDSKGNKQQLCFQVSACNQLGPNGECRSFKVEDQRRDIVTNSKVDLLVNKTGYTKAGLEWRYQGDGVNLIKGFTPFNPPTRSDVDKAKFDTYNGYGWYPISQMKQVGSIVRVPNGDFEEVANTGQPLHWRTEDLDGLPFAPVWNKGIFQGINNPVDAQKEGVSAFDGLSYIAVRGENRARSNQLDVFGKTKYAVSVVVSTAALKGGTEPNEKPWGQVWIEQYDENQKLIVGTCADGTNDRTPGALQLPFGIDWKNLVYRFTTCPKAHTVVLKLGAIHPQSCLVYSTSPAGAARLGDCNKLKKPEGSIYFDNLQVAPVLEVASDGRSGNALNPFPNPLDVVRSCRLYAKSEAPSCLYRDQAGVQNQGFEGYCLTRDPKNPSVCLQWYPVDVIAGNEHGEIQSDYRGRAPLFYCTEMKIIETRPAPGARYFMRQTIKKSGGLGRLLLALFQVFVLHVPPAQGIQNILAGIDEATRRESEARGNVDCQADNGWTVDTETKKKGNWFKGKTRITNYYCRAIGEILFQTKGASNADQYWYEYNGTRVAVSAMDGATFTEEQRAVCTKLTQTVKSDGENLAWFSRIQEGGIRRVPEVGYTFGHDKEPFGAAVIPDRGDPDNPSSWNLALPLPIGGSDNSDARGGAPYACWNDQAHGLKVCQQAAIHGVTIAAPDGPEQYQTGGLEGAYATGRCTEAGNRLKHLFLRNYGTWEWGARCIPNPRKVCADAGDRTGATCTIDSDCGAVIDKNSCKAFIDAQNGTSSETAAQAVIDSVNLANNCPALNLPAGCVPDANGQFSAGCIAGVALDDQCFVVNIGGLGLVGSNPNGDQIVCGEDAQQLRQQGIALRPATLQNLPAICRICAPIDPPSGTCRLPEKNRQYAAATARCSRSDLTADEQAFCNAAPPPNVCSAGARADEACAGPSIGDKECRGTGTSAQYVPLASDQCRWDFPKNKCIDNKRPDIDPAYCKDANEFVQNATSVANIGKKPADVAAEQKIGLGTCVGGVNNGKLCASYKNCPTTNNGSDYCAVAPVVGETRVSPSPTGSQIVVSTSGFVTLKFTSIVDPNQLPVTSYRVDWGDGEESALSGVEIRNRPNIDNAHTLFHLYSYWDLIQKVGQGRDISGRCSTADHQCELTVRIQIRDKWGWCNGETPTSGTNGAACNDSWKHVCTDNSPSCADPAGWLKIIVREK